ncbi:MAG: LamG-like jellyroll fold domain-containing protein, partial [Patescibacteria group bacterium]
VANEAATWTATSTHDFIFALSDTNTEPTLSTSIDPNSTATHTLSAYIYVDRGNLAHLEVLDNTIAQLVWEGTAQSTTSFTKMGGGWWRLSYTAATTDSANSYGIKVFTDTTAYVDGFQLEEHSYNTSYTDGSLGTDYVWTGTANNSTSTRTMSNIRYPVASNINSSGGTVTLWVKPNGFNWNTRVFAGNGSHYRPILSINSQPGSTIPNSMNIFWSDPDNGDARRLWMNLVESDYTFQDPGEFDEVTGNDWRMLTFSWRAANDGADFVRSYHNGTLFNSVTNQSISFDLTGSVIAIGNDDAGDTQGNFIISDTRIYSTALTDAEIADIYFSGLVSRNQTVEVDRFDGTKGQNPVGIWHFDESSGTTAADSSIYRNDLTVYSGASWNTQSLGAANNLTRNLKLDGSTGIASRSADTDLNFGTGSFSVSTWFRHSSTISGTDTLLADYGTAGWKVYMNSSGYICFGVDDDITFGPDDSACSTATQGSYADSKWHHLEAVKTSTASLTLYLDGQRVALTPTVTATSSLNSSSGLFVGADTNNSNYWDGWIDELVIYPESRTEAQAKTDYQGIQTGVSYASQASDPFTNGLISYWKMDESSGTLIDSSGNNYTGTWGGTGSHYGSGKYGNGASFNGTDDFITTAAPSSSLGNGSTSYSMSAWVYPITPVQNYQYASIVGGETTVGGCGFVTGLDLSIEGMGVVDNIRFSVPHDPAGSCYGGNSAIDTNVAENEWHLYTGVYDAMSETVSLYKDGKLIDTENYTASGAIVWEDFILMGRSVTYDYPGNLDEVRIYNRALSPSEISQLYSFAPGPVGYWKLDENTGTSAQDSSGSSNTGVVSGNIWGTGKFGSGIKTGIENQQDYITITDPSSGVLDFSNTDSFSLNAWVKMGSIEGSGGMNWVNKNWADNMTQPGYALNTTYGGGAWGSQCRYSDSSSGNGYDTANTLGTNLGDGTWHYFSCIMDRQGVINGTPGYYLFIDGVQVASDTSLTEGTGVNSGNITFGEEKTSSEIGDGGFDELKIYNYARSPSQIVQDMNASHPAPGSPVGSPVIHWDFEEGYDTTANNTGNTSSYDGSISGASWFNNGKIGRSIRTTGSGNYISAGDPDFVDSLTQMTVSLWLNPQVL